MFHSELLNIFLTCLELALENEGSFGCEAVACGLGSQMCLSVWWMYLSLSDKLVYLSGFLRLCTTAGGVLRTGD